MASRYGLMADTSEEAFRKLIELQRAMPPGEKLQRVFEMSAMLFRMAEENERKLHPGASDREVFLRAAARRLGREMVLRVYGWDVESIEKP
ncbi:MAG: hypothetical protein ABIZ80_01915 [Bryobacteraceae bacterium]